MKEQKLKEELLKLYDTGKTRIMKKYNLSIYCIHIIEDILNNKYDTFISKEVAMCLRDYDYNIIDYDIGYKVVR